MKKPGIWFLKAGEVVLKLWHWSHPRSLLRCTTSDPVAEAQIPRSWDGSRNSRLRDTNVGQAAAVCGANLEDCWPGDMSFWAPQLLSGRESACSMEDMGSIPGSGRSPGEGNGNLFQYSCLENPMDRGACWGCKVHGLGHKESDMTWWHTHAGVIPPWLCIERRQ